MVKRNITTLDIDRNIGDFAYPETHTHDAGIGLSEKTIHYISDVKEDPDWVREFRLKALKTFLEQTDADALGEQGSGSDRLRQNPLLPQRRDRSRNALGTTCRKTSSGPSNGSAFRSRSGSFSPASKRSSTAKRSIRTSRKRSANRA